MTAEQQKAKELIEKFSKHLPYYTYNDNTNKAKQCAILCVDEIIDEIEVLQEDNNVYGTENLFTKTHFWQTVKQEIINYK